MRQIRKIQYCLILLLASNSISSFSQSKVIDSIPCTPLIDSNSKIQYYYIVDSMPEYPGGNNEMLNFFISNINYPSEVDACCNIYIEFIIDTTGAITNAKVIRGLQEDLDKEVLRVVKTMPNWKPGYCNGIPVNVKYTFPINISLQ